MISVSRSGERFVAILFMATCSCLAFAYFGFLSKTSEIFVPAGPKWNSNLKLKSIINLPEWYRDRDWDRDRDKNRSLSSAHSNYSKLNNFNSGKDPDKQVETAWNEFFYGTTKTLMLELGARDGITESISQLFEKEAKWRIILIEGNPKVAKHLARNRKNSLNFNLLICDKPRIVHYTSSPGNVNGIAEFMSVGLLKSVEPNLLTNGMLDFDKLKNKSLAKPVECLPLADVLVPLEITHVNFFVLDIEGGELKVLKTIDFDQISFDVIVVETLRYMEHNNLEIQKKYADAVIDLLISKGYLLWKRNLGRNSWFVSPTFQPLKRDNLNKS